MMYGRRNYRSVWMRTSSIEVGGLDVGCSVTPKQAFSIQHAKGSALIAVLWTVCLLGMLVGSFAFDAHIESRITSYYRKRAKSAWLAKSGVEIAKMLMYGSSEMTRGAEKTPEDEEDEWYDQKKKLAEGLAIRGMTRELGRGTITIDIIPEPARRNVNLLKETDWERIFEVVGIPEDMWPELIDSFYDWTDKDDVSREYGAESEDYYEELDDPYRADNGPLDTVAELLLVKAFTRTILSGGALKLHPDDDDPIYVSGIEDLLTTYGDGKVNVNAASKRVLMTLPEVDELVAGAIIEEREGWLDEEGEQEDTSFKDVGDFISRISSITGLHPDLSKHVTVDSKIYRIRSVGTVHRVSREISCIVKHAKKQMTVLRWREEE